MLFISIEQYQLEQVAQMYFYFLVLIQNNGQIKHGTNRKHIRCLFDLNKFEFKQFVKGNKELYNVGIHIYHFKKL